MTAPYYEGDGVTLFHGDCLEITEWLAADVLVTDPPYGVDSHLSFSYKGPRPPAGHVRTHDKPLWDTTLAARDAALAAWGGGEALCGIREPGAVRWRAAVPRVPPGVGQGRRWHG